MHKINMKIMEDEYVYLVKLWYTPSFRETISEG